MQIIALNETTAALRRIPFTAKYETDGQTPYVGLTFGVAEIQLSKNGAAVGNSAGTSGEVGNGVYYYIATAGEVDTDGFLSLAVVKSGVLVEPVAVQVSAKWGYLDAAVSTNAPTVTQIRQEMDANSTKLANLDTTVSSRFSGGAIPELVAPLGATPTPAQLMGFQVFSLRNKLVTVRTAPPGTFSKTFYNDAGVAVMKQLGTDDGTIYTINEQTTP